MPSSTLCARDPSASRPAPPGAELRHLMMVAEWLASSPASEWKSRISAGTVLSRRCSRSIVNKTEGTSYSCMLAIKKPLKGRQDGAEAPHLSPWDPQPPAAFTSLCAAERPACGRRRRLHPSSSRPGTLATAGPAGSGAILSLSRGAGDLSLACDDHRLQGTSTSASVSCTCLRNWETPCESGKMMT